MRSDCANCAADLGQFFLQMHSQGTTQLLFKESEKDQLFISRGRNICSARAKKSNQILRHREQQLWYNNLSKSEDLEAYYTELEHSSSAL